MNAPIRITINGTTYSLNTLDDVKLLFPDIYADVLKIGRDPVFRNLPNGAPITITVHTE